MVEITLQTSKQVAPSSTWDLLSKTRKKGFEQLVNETLAPHTLHRLYIPCSSSCASVPTACVVVASPAKLVLHTLPLRATQQRSDARLQAFALPTIEPRAAITDVHGSFCPPT